MSDEGLERHSLRRPEPTQGQVESPRWRRPPSEASGFGAPRLAPAPPGPSRGAPPAPLGSLSDRRILRVPGARANAASLPKRLPPRHAGPRPFTRRRPALRSGYAAGIHPLGPSFDRHRPHP